MSEHMGDTASSASEQPNRKNTVLTLTTSRNMLPLVRSIVQDIVQHQRDLARLKPEQDRLDRQRRSLTWPERCRRYQLRDDVSVLERNFEIAQSELEDLGVFLLDLDEGRVGFPTVVNNRPAFFSWKLGMDGLRHWHFATESNLRPIPSSWVDPEEVVVGNKR